MAKKDKFKAMQEGGALGSFQDIVAQATTVAAIEKQAAEQQTAQQPSAQVGVGGSSHAATPDTSATVPAASALGAAEPLRFMRLPNPQIPITEYNLVTRYCEQYTNMTRQDFVELAIIEKLHADGLLPDDDFTARRDEIRNRPPRGYRKGTKNPAK